MTTPTTPTVFLPTPPTTWRPVTPPDPVDALNALIDALAGLADASRRAARWGAQHREGLTAATAGGIPLAAWLAAVIWARWWMPSVDWTWLTRPIGEVLRGMVLFAFVLALCALGGGRSRATGHAHLHVPAHLHGQARRRFIANHEAGHMAGLKYFHGRNITARIVPGGGVTSGAVPRTDHESAVIAELVVSRAGRRAVRSNQGSEWDQAAERKLLRSLPGHRRGPVSRTADRHLPKALGRYAGDRRRWANTLVRTGHVHA